MLSTRATLEQMQVHVDESMGVRDDLAEPPELSPSPRPQDLGRRPHTGFGTVAIDRVIPDPSQPRVAFSQEALERLAASIREKGQLSPIRVRWSEPDSRWIIIAGERRWRATQRAGLPTIDCYFHEGQLTQAQVLEQQLIENLLREDLQPVEEARAFCRLMEINGWNGKQLAAAIHVAPAKISRSLALLKLPADVQELVTAGKLSSRTAYELSRITDEQLCRKLATEAVGRNWTHAKASKAVRTRRGKRRRGSTQVKQTFCVEGGWRIAVTGPGKATYHDMKVALADVLEEVDLRIRNRVYLT